MNLDSFINQLAMIAFDITPREAWSKGICIACKQPALPKCHTEAGRREYLINATCEECFDAWTRRHKAASN